MENPKTANEFLKSDRYAVEKGYVTQAYLDRYRQVLEGTSVDIEVIDRRQMAQISALSTPTDILLTVVMPASPPIPTKGRLLFLDRVQDPGNVGTIIRIADWYGVDAVVAAPGCADYYNPKTVQSTMGSMVNVDLCRGSFGDLPPLPTFGAVMDGGDLPAEMPSNWILVIGNESKGIERAIVHQLDHRVTIQGAPNRVAESLNAAMATAILVDRML